MNRKQRRAAESRARRERATTRPERPRDEGPTIQQVREKLDSMADEELQQMYEDIQGDPVGFAGHVGTEAASDFLAALLEEMRDRNLIFNDREETTYPDAPDSKN